MKDKSEIEQYVYSLLLSDFDIDPDSFYGKKALRSIVRLCTEQKQEAAQEILAGFASKGAGTAASGWRFSMGAMDVQDVEWKHIMSKGKGVQTISGNELSSLLQYIGFKP